MARYLDPKADVTFKKVFDEHRNLVISLLNTMLPLDTAITAKNGTEGGGGGK